MWMTPAPPSTALVASSIWSGVGEVNTSPGQAASSMPGPTKPPCMGSCPEPPPEMRPTFPCTGASARTTQYGSNVTRTRSPCAAWTPRSASATTASGALISFFIYRSSVSGIERAVQQGADSAADERPQHGNPGIGPVRRALAGNWQDRVHDPRPEVASRVDRVSGRSTEGQADADDQECDQQGAMSVEARRGVGPHRQDSEHQHGRTDDLGDEVGRVVA